MPCPPLPHPYPRAISARLNDPLALQYRLRALSRGSCANAESFLSSNIALRYGHRGKKLRSPRNIRHPYHTAETAEPPPQTPPYESRQATSGLPHLRLGDSGLRNGAKQNLL